MSTVADLQPTPTPVTPDRATPGRRRARTIAAALAAVLTMVLAMVATAGPAAAAINRGATWTLTGTNCRLTVGGYPNANRYPGTASKVSCGTRHTIQVRNRLWWAGTDNKAVLFGQSVWMTYTNSLATPELDTSWARCPGYWDWQSSAQVYIDGVSYGDLGNAWGWWTACT